MKKSTSSIITERILKVMGAKHLYESPNFISKQEKINAFLSKPSFLQKKHWIKNDIDKFYYYETTNNSNTIIIYFHGGAFLSGPNLFHWNFLKSLKVKTAFKIYFPIYPKAPKYSYKESYDFLLKFYKIVTKKNPKANIIFMGDSAGGNIALSFAQQCKILKLKKPKQIFLFSPCLDLTLTNKKIDEVETNNTDPMLSKKGLSLAYSHWAKAENLALPILSPLFGDSKDIGEIFLYIGANEILLPENEAFFEKCQQNDTKINFYKKENMNHVYVLQPIKEGRLERKNIIKNLKNIYK